MKSFITLWPSVLYGHPCISVEEDYTVSSRSMIGDRNTLVNTLVGHFSCIINKVVSKKKQKTNCLKYSLEKLCCVLEQDSLSSAK